MLTTRADSVTTYIISFEFMKSLTHCVNKTTYDSTCFPPDGVNPSSSAWDEIGSGGLRGGEHLVRPADESEHVRFGGIKKGSSEKMNRPAIRIVCVRVC